MNICKTAETALKENSAITAGRNQIRTALLLSTHCMNLSTHLLTWIPACCTLSKKCLSGRALLSVNILKENGKIFQPDAVSCAWRCRFIFLTLKLGVLGYKNVPPEIFAKLSFWQSFFSSTTILFILISMFSCLWQS